MTKEFILNTLIKYKEDRSKCASLGKVSCVYLHLKTGNKCAVGEHLIDGEHQHFNGSVDRLFDKYGFGILTQEAQEKQIPVNVWMEMQQYQQNAVPVKNLPNGAVLARTPSGVEIIIDSTGKATVVK